MLRVILAQPRGFCAGVERAIEIVEARRNVQGISDFIFTPDGKPIESNYRTLKEICEDLEIPYGRYKDGGFVAHDLRHNFGTEILRESDIETAPRRFAFSARRFAAAISSW